MPGENEKRTRGRHRNAETEEDLPRRRGDAEEGLKR